MEVVCREARDILSLDTGEAIPKTRHESSNSDGGDPETTYLMIGMRKLRLSVSFSGACYWCLFRACCNLHVMVRWANIIQEHMYVNMYK